MDYSISIDFCSWLFFLGVEKHQKNDGKSVRRTKGCFEINDTNPFDQYQSSKTWHGKMIFPLWMAVSVVF
jgi:hypothetical protein